MASHRIFANQSLSTKLLLLTVLFVLVAEAVVLIPSVAKKRTDWLDMRLEEAFLVSLALEGASDEMIEEETARQLFGTANILGVTVDRANLRILILAPEIDPQGPPQMLRVDLTDRNPVMLIANAWGTLFSRGDALIRVSGAPRVAMDQPVDIIVSQKELRADLLAYTRNILILSLVISSLTAALVYWALVWMIVRPINRLTRSMAGFEAEPDSPDRIHRPSDRLDEIGEAERGLAAMQQRLQELLGERRRLAALGAGISKISHDLRNILASAHLISDRLAQSEDARVKKLTPRLISSLDRAIALSRDTLTFGRMSPATLDKAPVDLKLLVDEVFDDTAHMNIATDNLVAENFMIAADRAHLYRSLFNLVRNAVDAMTENIGDDLDPEVTSGTVTVDAHEEDGAVIIRLRDTGPGVPDYAREALYEPFKGSKKPGGSGLGFAIAAEVITAHGGALALEESTADGAVFRITLPASRA